MIIRSYRSDHMFPDVRLRRLRKGKIRNLVRETTLSVDDLVQPIFVDETIDSPVEILFHARHI